VEIFEGTNGIGLQGEEKVLNARDIEIAVAEHFNPRVNLIVPNVSWGWGLLYEADLVVLRSSDWADEIEIKCVASDIKADKKKDKYNYYMERFKRLWFAVPESLEDHPDIPERAGILSLRKRSENDIRPTRVVVYRVAKLNKYARKITPEERQKLMALAAMRIWTLKRHLQEQQVRRGGG
jgi:hypothetical protein